MGKMGLVIGSFLAIFLSYIMAVNCLLRHGELCFTSVNFGFQMHSTYLSLIYIMALLLVLTDSKVFSGKLWMKTCYSIVVFSAIILLGSLSSVICVFILSCLFLVKFLRKIQNVRLRFLAVLLLLTSVFGTLQIDRIGKEVDYTRYVLKDFLKNPDEFIFKHHEDRKSSMVRMALYNFSFDVMKEHPMGVGTGDVKDVLNKKYTEYGYDYFVKEKLNPHSQFFQTGIAFGIFGVVYLLFLLFYPILYHKRFEDANLFYFAIIIFITCLFESFLERQVGVIITCFIFTFFISIKSKEPIGTLN
ncbi:O-antigen ligase family protein [Lishizhenia tianjinensis]|nr:O-antigen ligase family protein [Lishizhenia tianjinensis]